MWSCGRERGPTGACQSEWWTGQRCLHGLDRALGAYMAGTLVRTGGSSTSNCIQRSVQLAYVSMQSCDSRHRKLKQRMMALRLVSLSSKLCVIIMQIWACSQQLFLMLCGLRQASPGRLSAFEDILFKGGAGAAAGGEGGGVPAAAAAAVEVPLLAAVWLGMSDNTRLVGVAFLDSATRCGPQQRTWMDSAEP